VGLFTNSAFINNRNQVPSPSQTTNFHELTQCLILFFILFLKLRTTFRKFQRFPEVNARMRSIFVGTRTDTAPPVCYTAPPVCYTAPPVCYTHAANWTKACNGTLCLSHLMGFNTKYIISYAWRMFSL